MAHRRLDTFRRESGLSHRALGELLGVHFSHAQRLCSGKRRPGLRLATRIRALTKSWRFGPIDPSEWADGTGKGAVA